MRSGDIQLICKVIDLFGIDEVLACILSTLQKKPEHIEASVWCDPIVYKDMRKDNKEKREKLDIVNQTRDRTPMPRPVMFRDKKKYDRNSVKDEIRKSQCQD